MKPFLTWYEFIDNEQDMSICARGLQNVLEDNWKEGDRIKVDIVLTLQKRKKEK